jgi:hypothetical protein
MKKNHFFLLPELFIALLFILLTAPSVTAQTAVTPSGSGTTADPYLIATLDNLYWITQNSSQWAVGKVYKQTANINASATSGWDGNKGFLPIGDNPAFSGSYDGQSFTISNLFINRTKTGVDSHIGLFGYTSAATFTNIKLTNVNVTGNTDYGSASVGALIGYSTGCTVTNCFSTGIVTSPQLWAGVGGLVGYQEHATTITNCSSLCDVSGTGNNSVVGGLIGVDNLGCIIRTSFSSGTVSVPSSSNYAVGGLIGEQRNGVFNSTYCSIINCYSTSSVSGGYIAGGLVGNQQSNTTVTNSYSRGSITGNVSSSVGGLIGGEAGIVLNSFWDTQTSGKATSSGGVGKTSAEMKTPSTFVSAGWDGSIWNIGDGLNDGYPYLDWENPNGTPLTILDPNPNTGVKATFSNLVTNISENHAKVNIRYHRSLASGNYIHSVWCETDTIDSGLNKYLSYRRSTDGGKTFDSKKYLGSFTKIADPKGTQYLAVDGQYVHIILLDLPPSTDPVANRLLYFRSTDNGATFESPKTIWSLNRNVGNLAMGDYCLTSNGGVVSIFASMNLDYYNKSSDVVSYASVDNGATFTQNSNMTLFPKETYWWYWLFSDVVSQGQNLYALASDYDKVNSVDRMTFVKSTDGGKTFTYTPISTVNGSSAIPDLQWNYQDLESIHNKKISVENSDIHFIWDQKDIGSSRFDLFYRKTTDGGISFSSSKNLSSALTRDDYHIASAAITSKGNYIYITCNYQNNNYWKIGLYYSKDKGETFSFTDLMNDTLFYAQDGRNAVPMIDKTSAGDKLIVTYTVNQTWNQKIGVTQFNATTGTINRKYYFPTNDFSYSSALSPIINTDGSINVLVHGSWPGMYAPRHLYSIVIEKEKPTLNDNYAVRFDHVTDSQINENIQIPYSTNLNFSSAITIEGWVKKLSTGQLLIAGKKGQGQDYNFYLGSSQNTNASNSRHPFGSITTTTQKYDLSGSYADSVWQNRWQHIAMTYDMNGGANNFKLYLNGKVVDSTTATGALLNGSGCIFVNHMPDNWWSYPMASALYDELRFWNKARSTTEIQTTISNKLTGNESGLSAYYTLDGSLIDATGKGEDAIFNYTGYYEKTAMPILTNVSEKNYTIVEQYYMSQNYPNPFNPSTSIKYALPFDSKVLIKIYNVLGQEVRLLKDEIISAGEYEVKFNSSSLPSGVYFYRLNADPINGGQKYSSIKKMMLLK